MEFFENYAIKRGLETVLNTGSIDDIKNYLQEGKPLLVIVEEGFWFISSPHYLVIFGYNSKGLIVHNGYRASLLIDYEEFSEKWNDMGNVFLVVYK